MAAAAALRNLTTTQRFQSVSPSILARCAVLVSLYSPNAYFPLAHRCNMNCQMLSSPASNRLLFTLAFSVAGLLGSGWALASPMRRASFHTSSLAWFMDSYTAQEKQHAVSDWTPLLYQLQGRHCQYRPAPDKAADGTGKERRGRQQRPGMLATDNGHVRERMNVSLTHLVSVSDVCGWQDLWVVWRWRWQT